MCDIEPDLEREPMDTEFVVSTAVDALAAIAACVAIYVALYVSYRAELPDVVVYLEHNLDKTKIDLVVANLGRGVARNVTFKGVSQRLAHPSLREPFCRSFIFSGIPVLVPGASRRTTLVAGGEMTSMSDVSETLTVSYSHKRMIRGIAREDEDFLLEYASFTGCVGTKSDLHLIAQSMGRVSDSLEEIAKSAV